MAIVAYTGSDTRGLVGGHVNSEEWNAITRLADNVAEATIGPGQPVIRLAGNDVVVRGGWASGVHLGLVRSAIDLDTTTGAVEGQHLAIMTMGVMYVAAGGTCTAGTQAGYNPATDRWGDIAGSYVAVPGCEFDSAGATGGLVKIRINRPTAVAA